MRTERSNIDACLRGHNRACRDGEARTDALVAVLVCGRHRRASFHTCTCTFRANRPVSAELRPFSPPELELDWLDPNQTSRPCSLSVPGRLALPKAQSKLSRCCSPHTPCTESKSTRPIATPVYHPYNSDRRLPGQSSRASTLHISVEDEAKIPFAKP